ncbi:IS66 family transposase [Lachnoclostridium sp.]|uniref:IS66 family transposase n=1 Tax=Lachnoclostridium sp. TaxID=2028282 RepID=UPI00289F15A4|nr:transposase [Lachnoclostridium sp.]
MTCNLKHCCLGLILFLKNVRSKNKLIPHPESLYWNVVFFNRRVSVDAYEDGRCSLSNNLSENALRPVTVGRKNWFFSDTTDGATANSFSYHC